MIWRLRGLAIPAVLLATSALGDKPGNPQGPHISNGALEWVVFQLPSAQVPVGVTRYLDSVNSPSGAVLTIALSDCQPGEFSKTSGNLRNYDCIADRPDGEGLCKDGSGTMIPGPVGVSLVGGWFDATGGYHTPVADEIVVSCEAGGNHADEAHVTHWGSAAKCLAAWGYTPSVTKPLFEACVRMARADYAGDGASHTLEGTEVFVYDLSSLGPGGDPIYSYTCKEHCDKFWLEASWDKHGAVCISHLRYESLPNDPQQAWGKPPRNYTPPGWKGGYTQISKQRCRSSALPLPPGLKNKLLYDRSEHRDGTGTPTPYPPGVPRAEIDPQCTCCEPPGTCPPRLQSPQASHP